MYVLTVDQRHSRSNADRVGALLAATAAIPTVRVFERTAGDEAQAVLDDPVAVVDATLLLVRQEQWSVGIGIGAVEQPLPTTTRAGRGEAFERARAAVQRAKSAPTHLAVDGPAPELADDAQAVLDLVALLVQRRSPAGWEAVALMAAGATQAEAASQLGVSRQAISQRLRASCWPQELAGRRVGATLLGRAAL